MLESISGIFARKRRRVIVYQAGNDVAKNMALKILDLVRNQLEPLYKERIIYDIGDSNSYEFLQFGYGGEIALEVDLPGMVTMESVGEIMRMIESGGMFHCVALNQANDIHDIWVLQYKCNMPLYMQSGKEINGILERVKNDVEGNIESDIRRTREWAERAESNGMYEEAIRVWKKLISFYVIKEGRNKGMPRDKASEQKIGEIKTTIKRLEVYLDAKPFNIEDLGIDRIQGPRAKRAGKAWMRFLERKIKGMDDARKEKFLDDHVRVGHISEENKRVILGMQGPNDEWMREWERLNKMADEEIDRRVKIKKMRGFADGYDEGVAKLDEAAREAERQREELSRLCGDLWNRIGKGLKDVMGMRHKWNIIKFNKSIETLKKAQKYCQEAFGFYKKNDFIKARECYDNALAYYAQGIANLKDRDNAMFQRDRVSRELDGKIGSNVLFKEKDAQRVKEIKEEINRLTDELSTPGGDKEQIKVDIMALEDELANYNKHNKSGGIIGYAKSLIDKGHSVDAAIFKAAREFEVDAKEIKDKLGEDLNSYFHSHKSYVNKKGGSWHLFSRLKRKGYNDNLESIDGLVKKLKKLEEKKAKLESTEHRTVDENEELNNIDRNIEQTIGELQLFEEHPELMNRVGGRFSKWRENNKYGEWFAGSSSWLRGGKDKVGDGIIRGYSKAKEMTAATLSFVFAFLIFFGMLYITWGEGSVYFPINKWQVIVFLFLATLLALIKISLSEDKESLKEAKEITGIFIAIGVIIALSVGYASEGISFWGSLIFCILCGVYLLLDFMTDNVIASFLLFIGMVVLVWFTMSGWMDMVGVQVEKLAIETGFEEAITTSVAKISEGASDVWLMLRHPNQWFYEKQMEQNMQKDEGQSEGALEITRTTMWPSIVSVGDVVNLAIDVENFGEYTAKNAEVYVKIDKEDSGDVHLESPDNEKLEAERYIGNILPETTAQEVFSVYAPDDCTGTFRLTSGVSYDYEVVATGDIVVISQERYDELVRQKKLNTRRHVTTSGGGPISVNVRTNLDEPIPIPTDDPKPISVHIAILNHRKEMGSLTFTSMTIKLPKNFEVPDEDKCDLDCTEKGDYIECDFGGEDNLIGDSRMFVCDMQYQKQAGDELYFEKPLPFQVDIAYTYSYEKKVSFSVKAGFIDEDNPPKKCD